jgi:hypothetical protein
LERSYDKLKEQAVASQISGDKVIEKIRDELMAALSSADRSKDEVKVCMY